MEKGACVIGIDYGTGVWCCRGGFADVNCLASIPRRISVQRAAATIEWSQFYGVISPSSLFE